MYQFVQLCNFQDHLTCVCDLATAINFVRAAAQGGKINMFRTCTLLDLIHSKLKTYPLTDLIGINTRAIRETYLLHVQLFGTFLNQVASSDPHHVQLCKTTLRSIQNIVQKAESASNLAKAQNPWNLPN